MITANPKYVSWEQRGGGGGGEVGESYWTTYVTKGLKKSWKTWFLALKFSESIKGDKTHANTHKEKRQRKLCTKLRIEKYFNWKK